jgi:hypothetical protein
MQLAKPTSSVIWPFLFGLLAVAAMGSIIVSVIAPGAPIPTALVTSPSTEAATDSLLATKVALEEMERMTQTAAAQTPWWLAATLPPSPTYGPTGTPDFSGFRHEEAGGGVIVWDTMNIPGYPIGVINQWFEFSKPIRVLAGGTNAVQGAIAVLEAGSDFLSPDVYETPRQSGPVEIVAVEGERFVLRSTRNDDTFFFDLPTWQFVDALTATVVAPTVTARPTFTLVPTPLPVPSPTFGFPPTQYPVPPSPTSSGGYPAPTAQTTAIP